MTFAAILALITSASWPALLSVGGGAVSLVTASISVFFKQYRVYFIFAGLAGLVVAAVGVTIWITDLQRTAEIYAELKAETDTLTREMGCAGAERALVCFQRQQREIAAVHAKKLAEQAETAAREQGRLQAENAKLQQELAESDEEIDAASDADDGPLPKTLTDAWARDRARRGAK